MDEKHLAVICNLEFLGPEYEPGYVHCGLNLAVSIAKGEAGAGDDSYLKPWKWDAIPTLQVWAVDMRDGMPQCSSIGQPTEIKAVSFPPLETDIEKAVQTQFESIKAGSAHNLSWDVKPLNPEVAHVSSVMDARPWHAFLAQASLFPYPIAQSLRLSIVFKLKRSAMGDAKYFVVAPEFSVGGKKYLLDKTASGLQSCGTGDVPFCCWQYIPDDGNLPAYAYVSPAPVATPKYSSTYIDLKTQLVIWPKDKSNSFSEDWRRRLADRAAEGLDLSQRIIDWVRLLLTAKKENLISADDMVQLRNSFLAALRDSVDLGLRVGPNQESGMTYLVGRWTDDEQKRSALLDKLKKLTWDLSLDEWRQFLRTQAVELSSSRALADVPYLDLRSLDLLKEVGELQRIRNYLQQNDNLIRLVLGQASQAFQKQFPNDFTTFSDFFHQTTLADNLLSRKMALARLGSSTGSKDEMTMWRSLISTNVPGAGGAKQADQLVELRSRFSDVLTSYAYGRLTGQPAPGISSSRMPPPDYFKQFRPSLKGVSSDLMGRFAKYLGDWASSFGTTLVPPQIEGVAAKNKSTLIPTTPVPHPLTFQIDQVFLRTEKDKTDVEDILRKISGVAILLREQGSQWRFLNMASIVFTTDANEQPLMGPFLVPSGLHYTQDQRQSFVSYNNQPLIGKSPLAWLAGVFLNLPDQTKGEKAKASSTVATPPPFYYTYFKHDPAKPAVWDKIIGLSFGKNYEVVAFAISNCGALPKELAESGNPCKLANAIPQLDACNCVIAVPYRRRVKIGAIRYCDYDAGTSKPKLNSRDVKLPEIPSDVYLRVRELTDAANQKATSVKGGQAQKVSTTTSSDAPVLFLVSEADQLKLEKKGIPSSFKFYLRPPATDVDTWDRWAGATFSESDRSNIWRSYFTFLKSNQTATPGTSKDISIDDPAVTGYYFRLVRVKDGTTVGEGASGIPKSSVTTELSVVQSPAIFINVTVSPNATEGLAVDEKNRAVTVNVREGEVYKFSVYTVVSKDDYTKRFDPIYEHLSVSEVDPNAYWMTPFSMYVEVATSKTITSEALWHSLNLGMTKERMLHADADLNSDESIYLHAIEVRRQLWRWQGRPLFAAVPTPDQCNDPFHSAVVAFESAEFGNRDDNDALWHSTEAQIKSDGSRFFHYQEDLLSDPRASYFRFSARGLHRYQGIYTSNLAVKSLHADAVSGLKTPWKRLLAKFRSIKPLPVPQVKVALPLTETDSKGRGNGDMLVVLNDAWFQYAGLAEELHVEVEHVRLPELPLDNRGPEVGAAGDKVSKPNEKDASTTDLYQVSPDPILTGDSAPKWTSLSVATVGPVGHTFDRNSGAQLFGSSSFIVSVPSPPDKSGASEDRAWWFAKLRFQRRFDKTLTEAPESALPSDFTLGHWVQYLPAFSLFERKGTTSGKVDAANYVVAPGDPSMQTLKLCEPGGQQPVTLTAGPSEPGSKFVLFLILTQSIVDAGGKPNQESYAGLYRQTDDTWTRFSGETQPPSDPSRLRARIIEAQAGDDPTELLGLTSEDDFWARLFEPEFQPRPILPNGEVKPETTVIEKSRARIVRISKAIESQRLATAHSVMY